MAGAARRWRRKWRARDAVLALLLASVLAPLALYSGAPISPFSGPNLSRSRALGRDPSNLIARNEAGKRLNALPQDTLDAVKEPVRTVASDANNMAIAGNPSRPGGGIQQVVMGSSIDRSGESWGGNDGRARNVEEEKESSRHPSKGARVDDIATT